jgi:hypothetical protein
MWLIVYYHPNFQIYNKFIVLDIPKTNWQTVVSAKTELQLPFKHICFMTLVVLALV